MKQLEKWWNSQERDPRDIMEILPKLQLQESEMYVEIYTRLAPDYIVHIYTCAGLNYACFQ